MRLRGASLNGKPQRLLGRRAGVPQLPTVARLVPRAAFACVCVCACPLAAPLDAQESAASLLLKARQQRYQQDSALSDYRVIARQRWSGGIGLASASGLGPAGRMRLAARFETVARMYWHHRHGAFAELLASRGVAPIDGEIEPSVMTDDIAFTLPYAVGRDQLWPISELKESLPGEPVWITHPLEDGSDSLYTFRLGGSLAITLPSGRRVALRELYVTPRRPHERLIVGSLWLDEATGALVRAAYRPSEALDLEPLIAKEIGEQDMEAFSKLGPFRGNVEEVVIEHGLFAERFWLPRTRLVYAEGTAKMGRITISIEQSFSYEAVHAIASASPDAATMRDAARGSRGERASSGRVRDYDHYVNGWPVNGFRHCRDGGLDAPPLSVDSLAQLTGITERRVAGLRLRVVFPCSREQLDRSPLLPPSIYDPSEELFTETDLDGLRREVEGAVAMSRQADWAPQPVRYSYGIDEGMLRFNRIEGLSAGIHAQRALGSGYTVMGWARLGVADWQPNAEVALERGSGSLLLRAAAYRRLEAANDWGAPLGLAASTGALLFGNDYGMYYRAHGAELVGVRHRVSSGTTFAWRAFVERQETAEREHDFALAHLVDRRDFAPNIVATSGGYAGLRTRLAGTVGNDPRRAQVSGELVLEGATGPLRYARTRGEARVARRLNERTLAAVVLASGTSSGRLPRQRQFFLGGPWTLHAHRVGDVMGEAFWFARGEVGRDDEFVRTSLFYDLGWAGARQDFARSASRSSAAGAGFSILDGLMRLDVSARLEGRPRWGLDLFLDIR